MLPNSRVSFVNSYSVFLGTLYLETLPGYKITKWHHLFLCEITFFLFVWIVQLVNNHFFLYTAMFITVKKITLKLGKKKILTVTAVWFLYLEQNNLIW